MACNLQTSSNHNNIPLTLNIGMQEVRHHHPSRINSPYSINLLCNKWILCLCLCLLLLMAFSSHLLTNRYSNQYHQIFLSIQVNLLHIWVLVKFQATLQFNHHRPSNYPNIICQTKEDQWKCQIQDYLLKAPICNEKYSFP